MDIHQIIAKYLSNNQTISEEEILMKWLKKSETNRAEFIRLKRAWELVNLSVNTTGKEQVLKHTKQLIKRTNKRKLLLRWSSVAAVFIGVFILAGGIVQQITAPFSWYNTLGYSVVANGAGNIKTYILPDSSVITLNGDSKIKYKCSFQSKRDIFLLGEAFFSVKRNTNKPFVVTTTNAKVKVLGTSFNVKAYGDNSITTTTVKTGKVAFGDRNSSQTALFLVAGEKATLNAQKIEKQLVTNTSDFAWLYRELQFNNTPLNEISKTLYRMYGKKVVVKSEELKKLKITAKFSNEKLNDILKILAMTNEFKVINKNEIYYVLRQ